MKSPEKQSPTPVQASCPIRILNFEYRILNVEGQKDEFCRERQAAIKLSSTNTVRHAQQTVATRAHFNIRYSQFNIQNSDFEIPNSKISIHQSAFISQQSSFRNPRNFPSPVRCSCHDRRITLTSARLLAACLKWLRGWPPIHCVKNASTPAKHLDGIT